MLTANREATTHDSTAHEATTRDPATQQPATQQPATQEPTTDRDANPTGGPSLGSRVLRVEWLGQTVASLCWIVSVFTYGISSAGDWLQLAAASAWLVANLAAAMTKETD